MSQIQDDSKNTIVNLQKLIPAENFKAEMMASMLEHKTDLIVCWIDGSITALKEVIVFRQGTKEDTRDLENQIKTLETIRSKLRNLKGTKN